MTEAELQAQLEQLKATRAGGARSVQFGERKVELRSDAELLAAIAALEAELNPQRVRNVMVRPVTNKGW